LRVVIKRWKVWNFKVYFWWKVRSWQIKTKLGFWVNQRMIAFIDDLPHFLRDSCNEDSCRHEMWGFSGERDLKEGSALCWLMMLMSGLFSLFESESKIHNRQCNGFQLFWWRVRFLSPFFKKKEFSVDEKITAFSRKMEVL